MAVSLLKEMGSHEGLLIVLHICSEDSAILITNASGIHARSISQYCLATLLTLYHALDRQIVHGRVRVISASPPAMLIALSDQTRMGNRRDIRGTWAEVLRGDGLWEDDWHACTFALLLS
jgi:pyridoxine/pyridoxamine 5'-phosphate oxidase